MLLPTLPSMMAFQAFSQGVSSSPEMPVNAARKRSQYFLSSSSSRMASIRLWARALTTFVTTRAVAARPIVLMALPRFWLFCS